MNKEVGVEDWSSWKKNVYQKDLELLISQIYSFPVISMFQVQCPQILFFS